MVFSKENYASFSVQANKTQSYNYQSKIRKIKYVVLPFPAGIQLLFRADGQMLGDCWDLHSSSPALFDNC